MWPRTNDVTAGDNPIRLASFSGAFLKCPVKWKPEVLHELPLLGPVSVLPLQRCSGHRPLPHVCWFLFLLPTLQTTGVLMAPSSSLCSLLYSRASPLLSEFLPLLPHKPANSLQPLFNIPWIQIPTTALGDPFWIQIRATEISAMIWVHSFWKRKVGAHKNVCLCSLPFAGRIWLPKQSLSKGIVHCRLPKDSPLTFGFTALSLCI